MARTGTLRRAAFSGLVATVVLGSALLGRALIEADPVVGSSELGSVPSMILADQQAGLLLAISPGTYGSGGYGGWFAWGGGATVQVLDQAGRTLRSVPIGQRPLQALVDPQTGYLLVLTSGPPGNAGAAYAASANWPSFNGPATYLSVIDPRWGSVLRSVPVPQPAMSGPGGFGGHGGGGGGGGPPPTPSPWQVAYSYISPRRGTVGALALDAARRRVYVGGGGIPGAEAQAQLLVFDAGSGARLRAIPVPAPVRAVAVDPVAGRVLVADQGGTLTILDAASLAPVASLSTGVASQLAVDTRRGRAFVLAAGVSTVSAIDTRRGTLLHVAAIPAGASEIQADEQTGHVFVESTGLAAPGFGFVRGSTHVIRPGPGKVTMLDAGSGRVLRTIAVGTLPFGAVLDAQHHQLYVGNFDPTTAVSGTVQVIDTARGAVLRSIAVPAGPFSLALDSARGNVVVGGLADESQLHGPWPGAVDRTAQLLGRAAVPTATPDGSPGAVTILRAAH